MPLVYVAHPLTTYGTPLEREALDLLGALLPDVALVNPATRYVDSAHWLDDWPDLVAMLFGLVVVPDPDGTIGAGCLRELTDAWRTDVPVALLDGRQQIRRLSGLRLVADDERSAQRLAFVTAGRHLDLAFAIARRFPSLDHTPERNHP
jgi:hypothetical protein